jgi:hypothetical protein
METLAVIGQVFKEESGAIHIKSKLTMIENMKSEGEEQSQEHDHHFFYIKGIDCSQRICPGRSKRQFLILL